MPDGFTTEETVPRAVRRVGALITHYRGLCGEDDDLTTLTDMLADVMHWAEEADVDFVSVLDSAERHYLAERHDAGEAYAAACMGIESPGNIWAPLIKQLWAAANLIGCRNLSDGGDRCGACEGCKAVVTLIEQIQTLEPVPVPVGMPERLVSDVDGSVALRLGDGTVVMEGEQAEEYYLSCHRELSEALGQGGSVEAVCLRCGDTFLPYRDPTTDDTLHWERVSGAPCHGQGRLTGVRR